MRNFLILSLFVAVQSRPENCHKYIAQSGHTDEYSHGLHSTIDSSSSHGLSESGHIDSSYSHGAVAYSHDGSSLDGHAASSISIGGNGNGDGGLSGNIIYSGALGAQSVHRHIYVHVPPSGFDDVVQSRVHLPHSRPQKHYKIIFIKAPSPPSYQAPIIPPAPQNEEKTIVYVLSKKPDQPADIIVPQPPATPPSKPEVYFIKYQTQKDYAGNAGSGVEAQVNIGDGSSNGDVGIGGGIVAHSVYEHDENAHEHAEVDVHHHHHHQQYHGDSGVESTNIRSFKKRAPTKSKTKSNN